MIKYCPKLVTKVSLGETAKSFMEQCKQDECAAFIGGKCMEYDTYTITFDSESEGNKNE